MKFSQISNHTISSEISWSTDKKHSFYISQNKYIFVDLQQKWGTRAILHNDVENIRQSANSATAKRMWTTRFLYKNAQKKTNFLRSKLVTQSKKDFLMFDSKKLKWSQIIPWKIDTTIFSTPTNKHKKPTSFKSCPVIVKNTIKFLKIGSLFPHPQV